MDLLDQFSQQVRATKIDQKYKDEYLVTIKQLVTEQVRSQHYITQLVAEKDLLTRDITQLTVKLKNLQMDLLEEEVCREKEAEKVKFLEEKIRKNDPRPREASQRGEDVRSEDYQSVLSDLQLLIQHREEIGKMKRIIKVCILGYTINTKIPSNYPAIFSELSLGIRNTNLLKF